MAQAGPTLSPPHPSPWRPMPQPSGVECGYSLEHTPGLRCLRHSASRLHSCLHHPVGSQAWRGVPARPSVEGKHRRSRARGREGTNVGLDPARGTLSPQEQSWGPSMARLCGRARGGHRRTTLVGACWCWAPEVGSGPRSAAQSPCPLRAGTALGPAEPALILPLSQGPRELGRAGALLASLPAGPQPRQLTPLLEGLSGERGPAQGPAQRARGRSEDEMQGSAPFRTAP